ncbi:MAG: hypothetical protein WB660_10705 [Candidatus Sulfotelmatobacter sp.]
MDLKRTPTAPGAKSVRPVLQPENIVRNDVRSDVHTDVRNDVRNQVRGDLRNAVRVGALPKSSGFGLPCARCRLYYPANLDTCPACNGSERVSPNVAPAIPVPQAAAEVEPDAEILEQEREAFLKEFRSQMFAAEASVTHLPVVCNLTEHHTRTPEAASICKPCYDQLQERVDVFEAALHIDLKEAAQIVYDAVWADPSDPNKTYTNAAGALLTELRKRSGVSSLLGPFHPLGN